MVLVAEGVVVVTPPRAVTVVVAGDDVVVVVVVVEDVVVDIGVRGDVGGAHIAFGGQTNVAVEVA